MILFASAVALAALVVPLDDGWQRTVGGETAAVDLPDDFHINSPWLESAGGCRAFKPETNGVYRKTFVADAAWAGKRVFLDVDGAQCFCDVVLNGEKIASWEYGSLGFDVDITDKLRFGTDNAVEVRCGTGGKYGCRWYTGCGITRGVKIVLRNPVAFRRHGLRITTPHVTSASAEVRLVADVTGWTARTNGSLAVAARIFDPDGRTVGETRSAVGFTRSCFAEIELPPVSVAAPRLWDLDSPVLYRVEARLIEDGVEVDRIERRFGIRTIAFGPDFGFKLNGRKVFLQGMANHQHLGALGEASYPRAWRRQVKTMKDFGYNCLRCAHNPYPEELLEICDEEGLLVVDELTDKWRGCWAGRTPFMTDAPRYIAEWVGRDQTHPSVILWSVGNETQHAYSLPYEDGNFGRTEYAVLDALVKRWDRSRPTTVAMFPSRAQDVTRLDPGFWENPVPPELSTVTEVASYNYVPGDYAAYKRQFPHLVVFQSEAAVNALTRAYYLMDRETSVGLCYWGAIEYWGESDGWPKKGWDYSFFRRTLDPHPQAWLVRCAFRDVKTEPIVKIGVETGVRVRKHWNDVEVGSMRLASDWDERGPARRHVLVFSNAEEVELLLNGSSLGCKRNATDDPARRNVFDWPSVTYAPGNLEAVAREAGEVVARDRIETSGPAEAIRVDCENPEDWRADGQDLQYVRVEAVDAAGRRVRGAKGRVAFSVEGAARFLAADDGNSNTFRRFDDPTAEFHAGAALGIFRSAKTAGAVSISVDAGALGRKTIQLKTKGMK